MHSVLYNMLVAMSIFASLIILILLWKCTLATCEQGNGGLPPAWLKSVWPYWQACLFVILSQLGRRIMALYRSWMIMVLWLTWIGAHDCCVLTPIWLWDVAIVVTRSEVPCFKGEDYLREQYKVWQYCSLMTRYKTVSKSVSAISVVLRNFQSCLQAA